ncbi:unnamed protein product [Callosobruchus maculatus]|uniref:Uncharacterized protein n=1 Tax=Callosobruchus maculatus TaxID=64391 RepID=A0A653BR02_CALMS|nr:unnamed protein product [Callosobruchus maculatus]
MYCCIHRYYVLVQWIMEKSRRCWNLTCHGCYSAMCGFQFHRKHKIRRSSIIR